MSCSIIGILYDAFWNIFFIFSIFLREKEFFDTIEEANVINNLFCYFLLQFFFEIFLALLCF